MNWLQIRIIHGHFISFLAMRLGGSQFPDQGWNLDHSNKSLKS